MARPEDVAAAAEDPRFPPQRYFVAVGVVIVAGLSLSRMHLLLVALVPAGILTAELLRRRAGYVVRDRRSAIALKAPFPGTFAPLIAAIGLLNVAVFVLVLTPAQAVPTWAAIVVAIIVATAVTFLVRRVELCFMAGVRCLEKAGGDLDPAKRSKA